MVVFNPSLEDLEIFAETETEAHEIAVKRFTELVTNTLDVCEAKARTERCDICAYTYPPSDVTNINGEKLCTSCYWDKYQYREEDVDLEDIPF